MEIFTGAGLSIVAVSAYQNLVARDPGQKAAALAIIERAMELAALVGRRDEERRYRSAASTGAICGFLRFASGTRHLAPALNTVEVNKAEAKIFFH